MANSPRLFICVAVEDGRPANPPSRSTALGVKVRCHSALASAAGSVGPRQPWLWSTSVIRQQSRLPSRRRWAIDRGGRCLENPGIPMRDRQPALHLPLDPASYQRSEREIIRAQAGLSGHREIHWNLGCAAQRSKETARAAGKLTPSTWHVSRVVSPGYGTCRPPNPGGEGAGAAREAISRDPTPMRSSRSITPPTGPASSPTASSPTAVSKSVSNRHENGLPDVSGRPFPL
jgi:hypothetical protein